MAQGQLVGAPNRNGLRVLEAIDEDALFGRGFTSATFPNAQLLDYAGLEGRLPSSSYAPGPVHPRYPAMIAALRELFDEFNRDGTVQIDYAVEVHVGSLGE